MRLDAVEHDAVEDVLPAVALADEEADAARLGGKPRGVGHTRIGGGCEEVYAAKALEGSGDGQALDRKRRVAATLAALERWHACGRSGDAQKRLAIRHQRVVALMGAVPFEEKELRLVKRRALAVAPDVGDLVEPLHPRRHELLHGELGRGVEIEPPPRFCERLAERDRERHDVGLEPRRELEARRLHLDETGFGEKAAHGGQHPRAHLEPGTAPGEDLGMPPGLGGHGRQHRSFASSSGRSCPGGSLDGKRASC